MRQVSVSLLALCVFASCNTATTSSEATDDTTATAPTSTNEAVTYAYPVNYSSDFSVGDPNLAKTVLEIWKDFDNNALANHKDAFADSVTMDLADGSHMQGPRDSIIAGATAYRSSFKNVASSIDVITTLKPKGKDESWVCVWGTEVDTHNNNKVDSVSLQENWMFNKDGKIAYMLQYNKKPYVAAK